MSDNEGERLQKVLAQGGFASRREVERWIADGRIKVNNQVAELGLRVIASDKIKVDNKLIHNPLRRKQSTRVIMYHKPVGEICTASDPEGRKTVFDSLPKLNRNRWIMIGRLDINTQGLLLFTNDGELANRLMHPSYEVEREYAVRILGEVTQDMLNQLKRGIELDDGPAKFDSIKFSGGSGVNQWYHVTLKEGRNREVRRMWEHFDLKVSRLTRVRFANVSLPKYLPRGKHKDLDKPFVAKLCELVDHNPD